MEPQPITITIPLHFSLWCWSTGEVATLLIATDEDHAYRQALAIRLSGDFSPENVETNRRWMLQNDTITKIDNPVPPTIAAFGGPLLEIDQD
jgi:hypothetical protein